MNVKNIKQLRQLKGVSQVKCSHDTGIPLRTLQRYEKGENIGDPTYLLILMKYFNLDYDSIMQQEKGTNKC